MQIRKSKTEQKNLFLKKIEKKIKILKFYVYQFSAIKKKERGRERQTYIQKYIYLQVNCSAK